MKIAKSTILLTSASLFLSAGISISQAQSVNTVPVGYSTWEINAGTGVARGVTTLSLPLYQPTSSIDGAAAGVITGITSSTLTVSGAGWTVGQLSDASAPFCIRITTDGGASEGRNLLVSTSVDNTADTLTIDLASSGVDDLTTLGLVAATDTFEVIECDTLSSLFGEPAVGGLVGGNGLSAADHAMLFVNGAWSMFYYDTVFGRWTEATVGNPDASNQVVLPDSGILFTRLSATTSEFIITGTVPNTAREITVNQAGVTFVGSSWPVDMQLSEAGFEAISEWQASATQSAADKVFVFTSGTWVSYYYDGTNWREVTVGNPISDTASIASGSSVLLLKASAASADAELSQSLPYTL